MPRSAARSDADRSSRLQPHDAVSRRRMLISCVHLTPHYSDVAVAGVDLVDTKIDGDRSGRDKHRAGKYAKSDCYGFLASAQRLQLSFGNEKARGPFTFSDGHAARASHLLAEVPEPVTSQVDIGKCLDRYFPAYPGLNARNRQPAKKRVRDSGCDGLKARRLGSRYPLFDDPFLVFRMDNRQIRIIAEDFSALVMQQHIENGFVGETELSAGGVFAPNNRNATNGFIIGQQANRIVAWVLHEFGAIDRLPFHQAHQLRKRSCAHFLLSPSRNSD